MPKEIQNKIDEEFDKLLWSIKPEEAENENEVIKDWIEDFDKEFTLGYFDADEKLAGKISEDLKNFIQSLLDKQKEEIIKMLENTDVQMSVNGDVSKDEIAMAKFIYKAHIKHIIKKIESAIIPPNSINGILPSETDSATKLKRYEI